MSEDNKTKLILGAEAAFKILLTSLVAFVVWIAKEMRSDLRGQSEKISEIQVEMRTMQFLEVRTDEIRARLADHETRLRLLE